ncbi:MAG: OsmC family protein [Pseudomonadota bacterium]
MKRPSGAKECEFTTRIVWTGNLGTGTSNYHAYERSWNIESPGQPVIKCSNDPLLGGDPALPNPEELLLGALSACHMLWFLHLASNRSITVLSYEDRPIGTGETMPNGAGRFTHAILRPVITLNAGTDLSHADAIHGKIHHYCFIARSMNFPVTVEATYREL